MDPGNLSENNDFEKWAKQFKARATQDVSASRSWRRLTGLEFPEDLIAWGFYLACDFPDSPGYEALAEMREESRRKARQARRLISRLETDRHELCSLLGIEANAEPPKKPAIGEAAKASDLISDVMEIFSKVEDDAPKPKDSSEQVADCKSVDDGSERSQTDFGLARSVESATGSVDTVPVIGAHTASDGEMIAAFDLANVKLRLLEKEMRQFASKRSANPSFFLALGITLIKKSAQQPHYRDYATLLNVAYQVFGHDELEVGEDAVRKTFRRFMKRNPEAFNLLDSKFTLLLLVVVFLGLSIFKPYVDNRTL
jgi:hypothetical protein